MTVVRAVREIRRYPDWALFVLLLVDAAALATIELFFLPLRLDGTLLPKIGDLPFPITALLAAVTTPWMVVSAAKAAPRLAVAGAPLFVWLLTLGVLGFVGPSANTMLLADWRTLLLLGGGALPGAIALGGAIGKATPPTRKATAPIRRE
ncbi:hypothetical protein F0L68_08510 [Solihabitans fulvus]|uniref:Uncharacterized protein n=1 Tax=Solihabitans fulvus TaxID=1892852 RepID=A0A5B2XM43_9PSEU|nr:hypothetical protein [Solihabitans fulvus]KAA2264024.1 hypothetical protein F0L68_08510 [Solihabitans fulvus]